MNLKDANEVLRTVAEEVDYNMSKDISQMPAILRLFEINPSSENADDEYETLLGSLEYLNSKSLIQMKTVPVHMGKKIIFNVKITALGIDYLHSQEERRLDKSKNNDIADSSNTIVINQVNSPNSPIIAASQNVNVNIEQTIEEINNLPESSLSEADKQAIAAYLQDVERESAKSSRWEKVKKALSWLIDKSADAFVASVPYLLEKLK